MSLLKKAIIKSYNAATHKADIQIAGSLSVWLEGVRVATDIPAGDVQADRQCTVLFLDPSNQDDAVVITIQGALPSGGGGGATTFLALTDTPGSYAGAASYAVQVNAVPDALVFGTTWATLHTFNAGLKIAAGQTIQDSGGTGRIALATSSPHITLTGAVDINSGFLAVGNTATPTTSALIQATHDYALGSFGIGYGLNASTIKDISASASAALALIGITGGVQNRRSGTGALYGAEGLFFEATHNPTGASTTNVLRGARVRTQVQTANGAVVTNECLHLEIGNSAGALGPPTAYVVRPNHLWSGTVPGTLYGYYSPVLPAASVAAYHAWWGGATPHFRCDGGNPPDAGLATEGDSPAWLLWMENGSLTSRRLRWRQQSSLGATDKVLIV